MTAWRVTLSSHFIITQDRNNTEVIDYQLNLELYDSFSAQAPFYASQALLYVVKKKLHN